MPWHKIMDELPPAATCVLLYNAEYPLQWHHICHLTINGYGHASGFCAADLSWRPLTAFTHWHELPEKPKDET